eukprot:6957480-Prymnesium_polylepis.1
MVGTCGPEATDFPENSSDLGHYIFAPRTENTTFDFVNQVGTLLLYPSSPPRGRGPQSATAGSAHRPRPRPSRAPKPGTYCLLHAGREIP